MVVEALKGRIAHTSDESQLGMGQSLMRRAFL